ncbi:MAG: hypothetical protein IKV34_04215 [Clostridia bacterium]|nr:hypothetical protein [Clostridia bacterium]
MKSAKGIATIAVMSATLFGGKLAMSVLPNIEPVTILIALYATVFGFAYVLPATAVFVVLDVLIYGFNTWVISYFIYWPLVAFTFALVNKKPKGVWANVVTAVLLTLFFGVLTSLVDVGLFMGAFDNFWQRFGIMYLRGILFFAIHVVSNFALFLLCYKPLCKALAKAKKQFLD